MWDRLRKQAALEQEQLHHLLEAHRPLLVKCKTILPNDIELSALAAMLHSFYTGVENILKRIAMEVDGGLPRSESWHRDLLNSLSVPCSYRPPAIARPLRDRLRLYVEFRHVFRHAYTFDLRWDKMCALVLDCEETLRQTDEEIGKFLDVGARGG